MAGPVEATNAERGQHRMLAFAWSQTPVGRQIGGPRVCAPPWI
jgi:hypothetical protein